MRVRASQGFNKGNETTADRGRLRGRGDDNTTNHFHTSSVIVSGPLPARPLVISLEHSSSLSLLLLAEGNHPGLCVGVIAGIMTRVLVSVVLVATLAHFLLLRRTGRY
jgi:hypothetical protein